MSHHLHSTLTLDPSSAQPQKRLDPLSTTTTTSLAFVKRDQIGAASSSSSHSSPPFLPRHRHKAVSHSMPSFHPSIISLQNSSDPVLSSQDFSQLSLSAPSFFMAHRDSPNSFSSSKTDLVSRQLWQELELELGEKMAFPLDVQDSCSFNSSSPLHSPSKMSNTSPSNSSLAESIPTSSLPTSPLSPFLVSRLVSAPSGHHLSSSSDHPHLDPITHRANSRGLASEIRQALTTTPKPNRPSAPAPPELLNQLLTLSDDPISPLDHQVNSARSALHRQRNSNISSTHTSCHSITSEISAIFANPRDSLADPDLGRRIQAQDDSVHLSNSSSAFSYDATLLPTRPQLSPRGRRYLSGQSTDSEVEMVTPKESLHSLPTSYQPFHNDLDSIFITDVDEILMRPELLEIWEPPLGCSLQPLQQLDSSSSAPPSVQPLRCRQPRSNLRRPPALQVESCHQPMAPGQQGDHPLTIPLYAKSWRDQRRQHSSRPSHAAHSSTASSLAFDADRQFACTCSTPMAEGPSSKETIRASQPPLRSAPLHLGTITSESRAFRVQSDPVAAMPSPSRSRVSNPTLPNTLAVLLPAPSTTGSTAKPAMRKRSASASAAKSQSSSSTTVRPPGITCQLLPPVPNPNWDIAKLGDPSNPSVRPFSNPSAFERSDVTLFPSPLNPTFAFPHPPHRPPAVSRAPPQCELPQLPQSSYSPLSSHPIKGTPNPRILPPLKNYPNLSSARLPPLLSAPLPTTSLAPPDLPRPPAPSPLNITPSCSPPPSPERFRFAGINSNLHQKKPSGDRSLFFKVSKDLFSRRGHVEGEKRVTSEPKRRSRSHSRSKVGLHLTTKSEPLDPLPPFPPLTTPRNRFPKSMFED